MKRILPFLSMILIGASCSHRIDRIGYQISKSDNLNCELIVVKFMPQSDSLQKIGEIKLGDTGFSVSCSEAHAIEILKNEACAIHADLINITEENRPDLWSSCYRCKAEFYKTNLSTPQPTTSSDYKPEKIQTRVKDDKKNNTVVIILAAVLGYTLGYLLFQ